MHRTTSTLNRTAVSIFTLSILVLVPAEAQASSKPQSSDEPARIAMGAQSPRTRFGTDILTVTELDAIPIRAPERLPAMVANECAADRVAADPTVAVQELPEPVFVHTLSKAEISSLANEVSGEVREAAGLTLILAGSVETQTDEARAVSGTRCVVIDDVKILPMKAVTVYVAREYPVGSCNYIAVMRHEEKHVAIARRLLSEYRSRLLRAVGGLSLESRGFPARAAGRSATSGRIAADISSVVQGVIDELKTAIESANRLLDEEDNGRTLRECPFW